MGAMMDFYNEVNDRFLAENYSPILSIYESRKKGVPDLHHPASWLTGVLAGAGYLNATFGEMPYTTRLLEMTIGRLKECLDGASFTEKTVIAHLLPIVEFLYETKDEATGHSSPPGNLGSLMPFPASVPVPVTCPEAKVGRNDPCPCGSGKKSKKCCGK